MKRRSEEYLGEADRFLAAARVLLEGKLPENSAAEAYQAMFSAARAALSELDREARTHRGTWTLFDEIFVRQDLFEGRLRDAARNAEELRYDSDYRLGGASQDEAKRVLADAKEFVAAVRAMFS
ncbi:MAG: HEPN domain-containing protein [Actinomycetota bacterium]|nr:HEPN domain-containing protein [Actinomycetota bacterium]